MTFPAPLERKFGSGLYDYVQSLSEQALFLKVYHTLCIILLSLQNGNFFFAGSVNSMNMFRSQMQVGIRVSASLAKKAGKQARRKETTIMWRNQRKGIFSKLKKKRIAIICGLCLGALLLVGCGSGAVTSGTQASSNAVAQAPASLASGSSTQKNSQSSNATQYGPQYLEKNLQVSIEVKDPRQTASDLQQWVSASDPQATSDGVNYQNVATDQYTVTLTYLIDIDHYTQVEQYLRNYAGQNGNTLLNLQETVQDVTSDYVDTQASLTNLKTEEQRLLTFLSQAQNMTDTLSIEQQLTQVDGQISDIEAHLNDLKGQTTYYTVTINLQPVGSVQVQPPSSPWSVIPVWQGAWAGVINVWQVIATLLVWLAAFSVYLIPLLLLAWLLRKRPWRRFTPAAAFPHSSNHPDPDPE